MTSRRKSRVQRAAGVLAAAGIGAASTLGSASAQTRSAINLVTHNSVVIDRPAAVVWPLLLDVGRWKQGARLAHRSGPAGQVGEILAAVEPNGSAVAFLVENVEVVPQERRTIKLYTESGALIGYAAWTLGSAGPNQTRVTYDVYSETLMPAEQARSGALAQAEREARESSLRRFDAELRALKRLAEQP